SLALGTSEVTLLEMTTAFATLANGGTRVWPTTLSSAGAVALKPLPEPARVVSSESAFIVTHLLRGVMRRGTGGSSARWGLPKNTPPARPAPPAGRGPGGSFATPRNPVAGFGAGPDAARSTGMAGADIALPIGADVMVKAPRWPPPPPFTPPVGIVMASVDSAT